MFVIKNQGVIKEVNKPPPGYGEGDIKYLNLPIFEQKYPGDIDDFQPTVEKLWPGNIIKAGSKSLEFVEIIKKES
jgi:hypothetical protein